MSSHVSVTIILNANRKVMLVFELHANEITLYIVICVWLLSLNNFLEGEAEERVIHGTVCSCRVFLLLCSVTIYSVNIPQCVSLCVEDLSQYCIVFIVRTHHMLFMFC